MDCIVHGVAESDTTEQLSLSLHFSLTEKKKKKLVSLITMVPENAMPI